MSARQLAYEVIDRPPRNEDWGGRTFGITDPFGSLLYEVGLIK